MSSNVVTSVKPASVSAPVSSLSCSPSNAEPMIAAPIGAGVGVFSNRSDLDERLPSLIGHDGNAPRRRGIRSDHGDAAALGGGTTGRAFDDHRIWIDAPAGKDHVETFPSVGHIMGREHHIQSRANAGDQGKVGPRPEGRFLEIGIHTWKWTSHRRTLPRHAEAWYETRSAGCVIRAITRPTQRIPPYRFASCCHTVRAEACCRLSTATATRSMMAASMSWPCSGVAFSG